MNIALIRTFRLAALLGCAALPAFASTPSSPAADRALELLARHGSVPLLAVGPHVEPGTYRVQVAAKVGRPDLVLADGTWLYHHRRIEGSTAQGTLVVRFRDGAVSSLALVTPAVVAALRLEPRKAMPHELLATK